MVPKAEFTSYYGLPIINRPVWKVDIPAYFFLGGLAGASSVLAAGAQLTREDELSLRTKVVALGAISAGAVALVHDLGRPSRFFNMLRVFKPTSPMSVGSWVLAAYGPLAGGAAVASLSGRAPRLGAASTAAAAALGPVVSTYTAALIADTAVPAWHDAYRELPFVFAGSSAVAAGGVGMAIAPAGASGPARRLATAGAFVDLSASRTMQRRLGSTGEPYSTGRAGRFMRWSRALVLSGLALAWMGRRRRSAAIAGGALLAAGSACTRLGVFHAGLQSADDPRYTIEPQKERSGPRAPGTA